MRIPRCTVSVSAYDELFARDKLSYLGRLIVGMHYSRYDGFFVPLSREGGGQFRADAIYPPGWTNQHQIAICKKAMEQTGKG